MSTKSYANNNTDEVYLEIYSRPVGPQAMFSTASYKDHYKIDILHALHRLDRAKALAIQMVETIMIVLRPRAERMIAKAVNSDA